MEKLEAYIFLFTDSLLGNLSLNPSNEFVIHTMRFFGNYNNFLMFLSVSGAGIMSISINYFFGKLLKVILDLAHFDTETIKQKTMYNFFHKHYILLLALSVIPFCGKFIQVAAGVFNIRYLKVILICMLFKVIYYSIIILM